MSNADEALVELKELFSEQERWTRRALARDNRGVATWPWRADAVAWCLLGGLHKILPTNSDTFREAQFILIDRLPGRYQDLGYFNDLCGYEAVMKLLS